MEVAETAGGGDIAGAGAGRGRTQSSLHASWGVFLEPAEQVQSARTVRLLGLVLLRVLQNRKDTITYLPGVAAIEPTDLMSYLQDSDTTTVVHRIIFKAFEEAHQADFILANTVAELETETIAAVHREKPFYAVGPIFPAGFTRSAVATSLWAESDCSQWLDSRPRGSVLYISFGSYAHVEKKVLEEIAHGVMASGASFVWALRPDIVGSNDLEPLPAWFKKETAGRGIVVQWCRQAEVLSHPAVGGFLTHCGWNSILESVWSGVPMLCFPLLTDQFTNRRLVVGDWKVAVDLGGGAGRMAVRREDVAEKIGRLMRGEEGVMAREEVKKVRNILQGALAGGGSSSRNFDRDVTTGGVIVAGIAAIAAITAAAADVFRTRSLGSRRARNHLTAESEYKASALAAQEVIWLRRLVDDIHEKVQRPTLIHGDNESALKLVNNPVCHA
ncbi:UDP-glycosyltransferase 86A1 [Platanthera zijinensis]|uniref:Glycosyltransferase n=1 Tax=Platanthera zijinensis TaxID=2320716 RepID=A0AAP0G2V9_9ASPA